MYDSPGSDACADYFYRQAGYREAEEKSGSRSAAAEWDAVNQRILRDWLRGGGGGRRSTRIWRRASRSRSVRLLDSPSMSSC